MAPANDLEFARLKRDFVATFAARARRLRKLAAGGRDAELVFECHKLAGVAGSYGFHALTEGADLLEAKIPAHGADHPVVASGLEWLVEALGEYAKEGVTAAEAVAITADSRLASLRAL